jgi:hypothetical protein
MPPSSNGIPLVSPLNAKARRGLPSPTLERPKVLLRTLACRETQGAQELSGARHVRLAHVLLGIERIDRFPDHAIDPRRVGPILEELLERREHRRDYSERSASLAEDRECSARIAAALDDLEELFVVHGTLEPSARHAGLASGGVPREPCGETRRRDEASP